MIRTGVSSSKPSNAPQKTMKAVRRGMQDAADVGFGVSYDEAPEGATGGLKHSAVQPTWVDDTLVWGYNADYAEDVEEGTGPHIANFGDIKVWARRVLGDEDAAGGVWGGIAKYGTPAQPYAEPGFVAMVQEIHRRGLSEYIDAEL